MRVQNFVSFVCVSLFSMSSAFAVVTQKTTEDFSKGSNAGQWDFFFPVENIVDESGRSYLYASGLDTFAPQLHTNNDTQHIFTGNYFDKHVTAIGFSSQIFSDLSPRDTRPVTLLLISGNTAAYKTADHPLVTSLHRWENFEFTIPKTAAQAAAEGWKTNFWPRMDRDQSHGDYEQILKNVDSVDFYYGDLELFYMFQNWDLGVTDVYITSEIKN